MPLEKLFEAVDETEHNYTWDYTVKESPCALYDINKDYFALITDRREIDEETGAMGDYRDDSGYCGYLFLKSNPQPAQSIPHGTHKSVFEKYLHCNQKSSLINAIQLKTGTSDIEKVEEIILDVGRVYISGNDLILDRI